MATAQNSLLYSLPYKIRTLLTFYVAFTLIFQDIFLSVAHNDPDPDKIDQDLFLDSETAEGSGGGVETKTVSPHERTENSTFAPDDLVFEDEQSSSTVRDNPFNTTMQYPEIGNATLEAENATIRGPTDTSAKGGSIGGPEKNPYSMGASITLILLVAQYFMHCI